MRFLVPIHFMKNVGFSVFMIWVIILMLPGLRIMGSTHSSTGVRRAAELL